MVGYRLKQLREQKGLKQRDLAKVLDISPSTIGMYETEAREPNNDLIIKIANYFNVSVDYLLGRYVDHTGNRIKQLRLEANINQDVLAKLLGLEIAGISKLETGRVPLKDEYILKLADYFNCSTDYLLGKNESNNNTYNTESKVEQILELADGLNIQEANYLIKQLNKAVIKIEKEAK